MTKNGGGGGGGGEKNNGIFLLTNSEKEGNFEIFLAESSWRYDT